MHFMQVLLGENHWFPVKKAVNPLGLSGVKIVSADLHESLLVPL